MRLLSYKECDAIFGHRLMSMLDDGYHLIFKVNLGHVWVVRLRHRSNGRFATLKYWPQRNHMEQWRGDTLVYEGKVTG